MENSIYVGLSAQISLERRLDALAHNVANMSTPGFRATGMKFEAMVSKAAENSSFVTAGESYIKTEAGLITQTGNPWMWRRKATFGSPSNHRPVRSIRAMVVCRCRRRANSSP